MLKSDMTDHEFSAWMREQKYTHTEALALAPGHTIYRDNTPLATIIYQKCTRNIYLHV